MPDDSADFVDQRSRSRNRIVARSHAFCMASRQQKYTAASINVCSGQLGELATVISFMSGAYAAGFDSSIVLFPAVSVAVTVIAPTVLKLPVGVKDSSCGVPPSTVMSAWRPVAEPSQ
jgi:hypothetical protein